MFNLEQDQFADAGNERMVLSLVLQDPDTLIDVSSKIGENDFLCKNHRALFSIVRSLYGAGVKVFDLMAVVNEADKKGVLDLIGGAGFIDALMCANVDRHNLDVYVSIVADRSTKYRLHREVGFIQKEIEGTITSKDESVKADLLLARAEERLLAVSMESKQVDDAENLSDGLRETLIERSMNPVEIMGISTGLPRLDKAINGLMPGTLTVVAARQKGGKSTLLLNMAAHVAYTQNLPVLFIDTELSKTEVQMRTMAHLSQVPERLITNGGFINNGFQCDNVWRACQIIEKGLLFHKYMPGFSMDVVKSMARKFVARYGIKALFFDYIKMPEVSGEAAMKEYQILGNISTGLKDLAGQLEIPVIAAAQMKRPEGATQKSRFRDNDVADSDRIGRYCNSLLAVAQKSSKEMEEDGETCGTHRLQILLARSGVSNFHGIDVHCDFPTYTMTQAKTQSDMLPSMSL